MTVFSNELARIKFVFSKQNEILTIVLVDNISGQEYKVITDSTNYLIDCLNNTLKFVLLSNIKYKVDKSEIGKDGKLTNLYLSYCNDYDEKYSYLEEIIEKKPDNFSCSPFGYFSFYKHDSMIYFEIFNQFPEELKETKQVEKWLNSDKYFSKTIIISHESLTDFSTQLEKILYKNGFYKK